MDRRCWLILSWNIRGINAEQKWLAVNQKVDESGCSIICLQETKKEEFDHSFIRKFCPRRFDKFEFVPSIGASGGLVIIWNSSVFMGQIIHKERFAITVQFSSAHLNKTWFLSNIYGPCSGPEKQLFIEWFTNLDRKSVV